SKKQSGPDPEHLRLRNNHIWENSRRYHGYKSEFSFPDDQETTAGIVWPYLAAGKPFIAPLDLPLKKNTKILDVPARSGAWIYSLLDSHDGTYAKARVTGLEPAWMVGDAGPAWLLHRDLEGPWPFTAKEAFHLIHGGALGGLLKDGDGFYANVFKHLVPWGWVEIREHDLRFCPRGGKEKEMEGKWDAIKQRSDLIDKAAQKFGKRITWGYSLRLFTKSLGWSKEDTDDLLELALQELDQEDLQLYSLFYFVVRRKPTSAAK
ncbi:hypothetical protein BDW75DRAFT_213388, partial [Aspergillus navahoensis]